MSQPNTQAQVQHAQPSVGSIAAHRPHTVAGTVSDLEPDIDADLDGYEEALAEGATPLPQGRFLDRERSWLAFNERVLELAEDPETPLLERANFLAIFASNLDEFFMVRVAGLKRRIATGVATRSASGLQPREVLEMIWARSRELMARHAACYHEDVAPALAEEGIHLVRWNELAEKEQARLFTLFRHQIFPVLTPLAVDPAHPFPYISGLSLNLAVVVRNPVTGHKHFARVKVPPLLSRFLECSPAATSPSRTSSPPTWRSCSRAWRCWSTTPSGSPATRTSRSRRTTRRTFSRPWRRSSCGAASARRCAWRSRSPSTARSWTCWCAS